MTDHEDDLTGRLGDGPELAARARADDDLAGVGERMDAAQDVVGASTELAHLAALRRAVQCLELRAHAVVAARLVDLGRQTQLVQRL